MNRAARWIGEVLCAAAVAFVSVIACWPLIRTFLVLRPSGESGGDYWLYVYYLVVGLEKLQGTAPGALWDAGYFFPVHEMSFLFTEPTLAVTAALYPVWKLVEHDFLLTLGLGSVAALVLGWVAVYGFARYFGCGRIPAVMAAAGAGTAGVFLWVLVRPFFWPLPVVLLAAVVADRACTGGRARAGLAGGLLMGVLAWSSLHLTVMATMLLLLIALRRFMTGQAHPRAARACAIFALTGAALAAFPLISQAVALLGNGFSRPLAAQASQTPNLTSFIAAPWTHSGRALAQAGFPPASGEFAIGISPILWVLAATALVSRVIGCRPAGPPDGRTRRRTAALVCAALVVSGAVAVLVPGVIGGHVVDRVVTAALYGAGSCAVVLLRRRLGAALRHDDGWLASCAAVFALMCLGPVLRLSDDCAVPSPLLPVFRAPGFSGIRVSARWSLMLAPCLATAAALAVQRIRRPLPRSLVAVVLAVAMIADNVQPGHWSERLAIPPSAAAWQPRPVDHVLASLPRPGAVLELPYLSGPPESSRMVSRLFHRRPLVNGYSGFEPTFFTDHIVGPNDELLYTKAGPTDRSIALLREFGARYWVIHRSKLPPTVAARFGDSFGPLRRVAVVGDGSVLVYEDPAVP